MYTIARSLVRQSTLRQGLQLAQCNKQVSMKVLPATQTLKNETFFEKNARLQREMSPHLTIYSPQLTSMLSISHRMTGCALGASVWALGLAALISPQDIANYASVIEGLQLSSGTLGALKFILAYPLAYHSVNGVRHLLWDTGRFLTIKEVYSTGYAAIVLSFVLAGVLAAM